MPPLPALNSTGLSHLDRLEAESIHILREVAAECRNPVMLYSIGKDSSVLLHLLLKAFAPAPAADSRCCTSTPAGSSAR
jgi:sulfate adenylyltransferase subunit 2